MNQILGCSLASMIPLLRCHNRFGPISPVLPNASPSSFPPPLVVNRFSKYSSIPSASFPPRSFDPLSCSITSSPMNTISRPPSPVFSSFFGAFWALWTILLWWLIQSGALLFSTAFVGSGHVQGVSLVPLCSSKQRVPLPTSGSKTLLYCPQWTVLGCRWNNMKETVALASIRPMYRMIVFMLNFGTENILKTVRRLVSAIRSGRRPPCGLLPPPPPPPPPIRETRSSSSLSITPDVLRFSRLWGLVLPDLRVERVGVRLDVISIPPPDINDSRSSESFCGGTFPRLFVFIMVS
mmetsp:Transcript_4484/g.11267  ORF Transcript_4484/g.11267 Transcript_4484/m.11267 type:complete len:294 (-) Transcript_4484:361-1242(-)